MLRPDGVLGRVILEGIDQTVQFWLGHEQMNPEGVRLSRVQLWWEGVMKVALPYSVGR